jgi:hypothetical protein
MTNNKRAFNKARKLALGGKYQEALALLEKMILEGDLQAKAAVVYLYAFLLKWDELLPLACEILIKPEAYYAANVFDEFSLLIATMAQETGKWAGISKYVDKNILVKKLGKREQLVIKALKEFLDKKGVKVKKIFPVVDPEERSAEENAKHYKNAVDDVFTIKPKFKDPAKKHDLEKHLFALAVVFEQEKEILKSYKAENPLFGFEDAVIVARILLKEGQNEKAWDLIESKINNWYPVDVVQLMPVELLVEDDFRPLLDQKRREFLLKSPKCGGK